MADLLGVARLHIVAIASLGTLTFGWLFTGQRPWLLAAVAGLDWFLVNLLNRVADLPEDRANRVAGADFVARHRRAVLALGLGLLAGSLLGLHRLAPAITPLRLAYHLLGLAYNWPLLPGRRRLKTLYCWKNTASATGFLITVFGYPLAQAARAGTPLATGVSATTLALAAAFFFLFELSYECVYDLRDVPGDRRSGVRTYAAVHGEGVAAGLAAGLMLASVAVLAAGRAAGVVPWRLAVMGAAPLLQLAVLARIRHAVSAAHCIGLTWLGALLLALYHVWVALDLPGARIP